MDDCTTKGTVKIITPAQSLSPAEICYVLFGLSTEKTAELMRDKLAERNSK